MDATFGGGGHSNRILETSAPHGRVIALDRDPDALRQGETLTARYPGRLTLCHGSFEALDRILDDLGVEMVDGIMFDLGVSSWQLDCAERGFSFRFDGPLDMRMDATDGERPTAADLVNTLGAEELAEIFFRYGEERHSRRIARAIVEARGGERFRTTRQLAALLEKMMPGRPGGIHPATRVFQALRIAVNGELEALEQGLNMAMERVRPGGRLVVISFHSLEDRIVKRAFLEGAGRVTLPGIPGMPPTGMEKPEARFRLVSRKPVLPDETEMAANPRARSARLRIAERLGAPGESR